MASEFINIHPPELKGLKIRSLSDARLTEKIRVIDRACLAVKYQDEYYNMYVREGLHQYNLLAYYYDLLVGSLTCRLERAKEDEGVYVLYVMTICVLEPYRHLKIGSHMLVRILENVLKERRFQISAVTLHMQVGSPVIKFYEKFGFTVEEEVKDYYNELLEERDALLLKKSVPLIPENNKNKKKK